jgi:hypothetical protein
LLERRANAALQFDDDLMHRCDSSFHSGDRIVETPFLAGMRTARCIGGPKNRKPDRRTLAGLAGIYARRQTMKSAPDRKVRGRQRLRVSRRTAWTQAIEDVLRSLISLIVTKVHAGTRVQSSKAFRIELRGGTERDNVAIGSVTTSYVDLTGGGRGTEVKPRDTPIAEHTDVKIRVVILKKSLDDRENNFCTRKFAGFDEGSHKFVLKIVDVTITKCKTSTDKSVAST